jgi:hypothetical protein
MVLNMKKDLATLKKNDENENRHALTNIGASWGVIT